MRKVAALALSFIFAANTAIAENRKEAMSLQGIPRSPLPSQNKLRQPVSKPKEHYESSYPHTHWQKALYFKQKGDLDNALIEFLKTTQENPHKVEAFYEQALIFRQRGYQKLAKSALEQALVIKPDYSQARMLLAAFCLEKGDIPAAFGQLSKCLGIPDLSQVPKLPPLPPVREPSVIQIPHGPMPEIQVPESKGSGTQDTNKSIAPNTVSEGSQPAPVKATAQEAASSLDELLRGIPGIDPNVPDIKSAHQGLNETADQILASANSAQAQQEADARAEAVKPSGPGPLAFLDPLLKPLLNPLSVFGVKPGNKPNGWFGWFKDSSTTQSVEQPEPSQDTAQAPEPATEPETSTPAELLANSVPDQATNNESTLSPDEQNPIINETAVQEEQLRNQAIAEAENSVTPNTVPTNEVAAETRSLPTPIKIAMTPMAIPSPGSAQHSKMTGVLGQVPLPQTNHNRFAADLPEPSKSQKNRQEQKQPSPNASVLGQANSLDSLSPDNRQIGPRQQGLNISAQPNLNARTQIAIANPVVVQSQPKQRVPLPQAPGVVKSTSNSFSLFGFDIIPSMPKFFHKPEITGPKPIKTNLPIDSELPPEPKLAKSHKRNTFIYKPTKIDRTPTQPLPVTRNSNDSQLLAQADPNALNAKNIANLERTLSRNNRAIHTSPLPTPYVARAQGDPGQSNSATPNITTPGQMSKSDADYAASPLVKSTTSEPVISASELTPSVGNQLPAKIAFVQQGPAPIRTASKQNITNTPSPSLKRTAKRPLFAFLPSMPNFNLSLPLPQTRRPDAAQNTPNPSGNLLNKNQANFASSGTAASSQGNRHQPIPVPMKADNQQTEVSPINNRQQHDDNIFAPLIKATGEALNLPELIPSQPPLAPRVAFNTAGPQPIRLGSKSSGAVPTPLKLNISRARANTPNIAPNSRKTNTQVPLPQQPSYTPDQASPQPVSSLGSNAYAPSSNATDRNLNFAAGPQPIISKHTSEQINNPQIKHLASQPPAPLPEINPLLPNNSSPQELDIKPTYKAPKVAFSTSGPTPVRFAARTSNTMPSPLPAQTKPTTNPFNFTPQSVSSVAQVPQALSRQTSYAQEPTPQPTSDLLNKTQFTPANARHTNQFKSFAGPTPIALRAERANAAPQHLPVRSAGSQPALPEIAPLLPTNQAPIEELGIKPSYKPPKVAFAANGPTPIRLSMPNNNTLPQPSQLQARQPANTFNFKPQASQNQEVPISPQSGTRRLANNQEQIPQPTPSSLDKTQFVPSTSDQRQAFNTAVPVVATNLPEQSIPLPQLQKLQAVPAPNIVSPAPGQWTQSQAQTEALSIKPSTGSATKSAKSAKAPTNIHGPGELANMFFPNWFKIAPVNAKLNVPLIVKPAQPIKPVSPPKEQIANNTDEADDFWTRKLKYIKAHGTANLGPGEAFMFSEETGEAVLFMPKGKSVRRRIAEPAEDPQALARTRRPDLFSPTDFTYTLTLLGKILPRNHNNGAPTNPPSVQTNARKEEAKSMTVKELLNQPTQANMFDWLKKVIGQ
jgi:tetratricopeptide (TPR) repeat protein